MTILRLRLIGRMEAWTLGSESVLPMGRKTRALLALVAMASPRPVMRARAADLLWSRRSEEQARASLRQEIHRLLNALAPAGPGILAVTRDHIELRAASVLIDVEEINRLATSKTAALSMLDGELLEDLDGIDPAFDAWLAIERERLRLRARTLAELIMEEKESPDEIMRAAERVLAIDRAHEGAWRALMRAYAVRGERGMAVQAYDRCKSVLADLLDTPPSAETQQLLAQIRNGRFQPAALPGGEAALVSADADLVKPQGTNAAAAAAAQEPRHRSGARVAVLPLELVGNSATDTHLAIGLAEEITTALSRFRWLSVIASSSVARFAETSRDHGDIQRRFDIDFLVDGSVQTVRNRVRITLRLLDCRAGGEVMWAQRFDHASNNLLAMQDEIAAAVVAQIDPEMLLAEAKRVTARPVVDSNAYDLVLRALPLIERLDRLPFLQAGDYLERAIALEPDYAAAHAWYAYWHVFLVGQAWTDQPRAMMARAGEHAERAVMLDSQDARALTIAGHVGAFLRRRVRESLPLHERALAANPNLTMAWALSAFAYTYVGDLDEAERRAHRYKRLAPLDPHAFFYDTVFIFIPLLRGDYESAVKAGREITQMNPAFANSLKPYLAALGHAGAHREAALVLNRLVALEPGFSLRRFEQTNPFENPQHRERFLEGLRLAGVPDRAPGAE
jgi:DNA-binding SARP family transcriptional activator/TolB-like protein